MRRAMMLMIAGREMTRENITLRKPLATCHRNSHLSITWLGCLSPQLTPIYYLVRPPVTTTHIYLSLGQATCHNNSHLSITWSGHLSPQLTSIFHLVFGVKEEEEFNHKLQATSGCLGQGWKRINHINLQASSSPIYKHHLVFWVNDLVLVPAFTSNF